MLSFSDGVKQTGKGQQHGLGDGPAAPDTVGTGGELGTGGGFLFCNTGRY